MKICKLIIPDYQQFQDFELDLTYPEEHQKAGEPLDKVCFIGRNGTGKSTLLRLIDSSLRSMSDRLVSDSERIILKLKNNNQSFYFNSRIKASNIPNHEVKCYLSGDIDKEKDWINKLKENKEIYKKEGVFKKDFSPYLLPDKNLKFKDNSDDLVIYSPEESANNLLTF